MIPAEHRFPCGQCGASLTFRPGQQELVCDWCGHRQTIGPGPARAPGRKADDSSADPALQWSEGPRATGPALREIPLAEGLDLSQGAADIVQTVRTLSCPNCGAQVDLDADHHASACPFCATPVVTDTGPTRRIIVLRPVLVRAPGEGGRAGRAQGAQAAEGEKLSPADH